MAAAALNLFYEEPDGDRWLPFDRYPRRAARRLLRGKPQPGGHRRVFLNLCAGLDRLGISYRINDYGWADRHPDEPVGIIGKPHVLDRRPWRNPIVFGAAVFSHPIDDPHLFDRLPVRRVLVPGPWMKEMWKPHWDAPVAVWPVGIDTEHWQPTDPARKTCDFILYDKVMWRRDHYDEHLLEPIRRALASSGRSFREIRYGAYREEEFHTALSQCRAMIFLSRHETQGIAYQQALSCNVPILAWDCGGFWQDPSYYPHRVKFGPVSSVPYWDERCGMKFGSAEAFAEILPAFWERLWHGEFAPREYILENLTLEASATRYVRHLDSIAD